jgi:outer membrane lipoprotein SlyB
MQTHRFRKSVGVSAHPPKLAVQSHSTEVILNPKSTRATVIGILTLIGMLAISGCSQKPSREEIAAEVKKVMAEQAEQKTMAQTPVAHSAPAAAKHHKTVAHERSAPVTHGKLALAKPAAPEHKTICADCGIVVSVKAVEQAGKGSGLGVVAGGLLGGLAGNQVGNGTGRDLATLAGIVGGAIAGNKVEEKVKKTADYVVTVKLENGHERVLHYKTLPNIATGEKVRLVNDRVVKL